MSNVKIVFEISKNDNFCYVHFPDNLNNDDKVLLSEKVASFLTNLQTGQLMSFLLHSIVEGGILINDKIISDLIIKKIMQNFLFSSDEKPIISPTDAFVFKEKQ